MNDKSYVSLEQQVCVVCGKPFETGALLMDRRLKDSLERHTVTGWGLCPEHEKLRQEGFVALVECDPEKSNAPEGGGMLNPEQVYRTGVVAYMKRDAFLEVFKLPTESQAESTPAVFVEPKVMTWLKSRMPAVSQ